MIRSLLLLLMSCVVAYGQDTLAVVEPKYGRDAEIFLTGDTILLRMPYDAGKTALKGSEAWLFHGNKKLGDIDLKVIGSEPILGIKRYADTTYYYSVGGRKKQLKTIIYRSVGLGPAVQVSELDFYYAPLRGVERGENFLIAAIGTDAGSVFLTEFNRGKLVKSRSIKLPMKDEGFYKTGTISFMLPGEFNRISANADGLKLTLDGDTLIAILDDISERKSTVLRRNLVTGEEKVRTYGPESKRMFVTYLAGNQLYRIVTSKEDSKLVVYNFDSNEIVYSTVIPEIKGYERLGPQHDIRTTDEIKAKDTRMADVKIGLAGMIVNDYTDQKIISFGIVDKSEPYVGFGMSTLPIALTTLVAQTLGHLQLDNSLRLVYSYLQGSPQTGFKQMDLKDVTHLSARIDQFELEKQKNKMNMDYTAYVATDTYCVAVVSRAKSGNYVIMKFPRQP